MCQLKQFCSETTWRVITSFSFGCCLQYQNGSCEAATASISEEGRPVDQPHEVQKMQGITRSLRFSTARRSLGMTPRGKCGLFHTSMERFSLTVSVSPATQCSRDAQGRGRSCSWPRQFWCSGSAARRCWDPRRSAGSCCWRCPRGFCGPSQTGSTWDTARCGIYKSGPASSALPSPANHDNAHEQCCRQCSALLLQENLYSVDRRPPASP